MRGSRWEREIEKRGETREERVTVGRRHAGSPCQRDCLPILFTRSSRDARDSFAFLCVDHKQIHFVIIKAAVAGRGRKGDGGRGTTREGTRQASEEQQQQQQEDNKGADKDSDCMNQEVYVYKLVSGREIMSALPLSRWSDSLLSHARLTDVTAARVCEREKASENRRREIARRDKRSRNRIPTLSR